MGWCYPALVYFTTSARVPISGAGSIIVLGAIGTFMALTGFYLGIVHYRSRAKKKAAKLFSPFPRKRYQWHHFFGTVGGVLIIAWVLTGLLSVVHFPHTETTDYPVEQLEGRPLGMTDYCTDLTALRQAEPELRALTLHLAGAYPRAEG